MKTHTTGTAGEIFAAKAEQHAAGVREHSTAGAEVGTAAPDFAGELARAFVPRERGVRDGARARGNDATTGPGRDSCRPRVTRVRPRR